MKHPHVLIIGCGVAGATTALRLSEQPGVRVTVVTREPDALESNTRYAQGGITTVADDDRPENLIHDILEAGAGASSPAAAKILAEEGPLLLDRILRRSAGVVFDQHADGSPYYGQEAVHSRPRILHVGDRTGEAIMRGLLAEMHRRPNVTLLSNATVVDLLTFPHHSRDPLATYGAITCHGAYVFDRTRRTVEAIVADRTVLATGGLGRIYRNTTNPPGARGDGLAMAHRAGARIVNTEYIQFHPTALAVPGGEGFLISEAVRGEGGVLLTPDGRAFMGDYAPDRKDLAPRDVVARAIHHEMESNGYSHVLLDIGSHMDAAGIRERFPTIYARCLQLGIDMTREPIPVVPAAHYSCGGVWVDEWGRSSIGRLFAVGEVSCTGLHGANRLASTSLLEGVVWGDRAARNILASVDAEPESVINAADIPRWDERGLVSDADPALIQGDMQTVQNIMWHYVGLVRNEERLSRAIRELRHLWTEIEMFYRTTRLSDGLIGLRNAVETALIVAQAARHNPINRGCHFRQDSREETGRQSLAP